VNQPKPDPQPAEADDALRWQLYNDQKKQAWEDIQSSTDSYDQGLITLSSGILALSIAFIKDIVPLEHAIWLELLYISWAAFGVCILTTVISFQVAKEAQNEHLEYCWNFYIGRDDSYRQKRGNYSRALTGCTILAGGLFVLALACTIVFAIGNIGRYSKMPHENNERRLQEGRGPVSVTPIPAPAPKNQPPPPANPPASTPSPKKD
jgi:hypothetical protein